ncbi:MULTISPECIES: hypothetical protein [unclassified Pseudomonas]|uniref:hypothetical protein n=1 Tax=Pseudomonas TaxID=286 RepID=UPI0005962B2A|nr:MULTISPECIES: hypothetical protein [unclassified Pseudomonas]MBD0683014.1 hypothetical protein [Pseudomonas sp. PSB18]
MGLILLIMSVLAFAILGPVVMSHQGSEQNRKSSAQALTMVITSLKSHGGAFGGHGAADAKVPGDADFQWG